jgi:hypothetical protein
MLSYPASGYLKGFHMTDNEQPFSKSVSWILLFFPGTFLKDGYLHLLLIDLIAKKDDLFVFVVNIHFGKSLQASFASSSRESGSQNRSLNNKFDSRINSIYIFDHGLCFWSLIRK